VVVVGCGVVVVGGGGVVGCGVVVVAGGIPEGLDGLVGCGVMPVVVGGGGAEGLDGVEGCLLKSAETATSLPTTSATTVAARPTKTVRREKRRVRLCPPETRAGKEAEPEGICPGGKPCPAEGGPPCSKPWLAGVPGGVEGVPSTSGTGPMCGVPGTIGTCPAAACPSLTNGPGNSQPGADASEVGVFIPLFSGSPQFRQKVAWGGLSTLQEGHTIVGVGNSCL
jgi:hypothetical protein